MAWNTCLYWNCSYYYDSKYIQHKIMSKEAAQKQNYKLEKICGNCKFSKTDYWPVPGGPSFKVKKCTVGDFPVEERGTCDVYEQKQ